MTDTEEDDEKSEALSEFEGSVGEEPLCLGKASEKEKEIAKHLDI